MSQKSPLREILVVHHSHTDMGYTSHPLIVEKWHQHFIDEAVAFCEQNGISFYAVNKSFPEEQFDNTKSRKINADLFIDDRNIGGVFGWGEVYQMITNEEPNIPEKRKGGLFSFFR